MGGVPTLEATHTWDASLVLHDHRPLSPEHRWRCRCDTPDGMEGLRSLGEASLPSDPLIGGIGNIPRPGRRGGRTVPYTGRIHALSAIDLREATDTLLAAFEDVDVEKRMDITLDPDYRTDAYFFMARGTATVSDAPVRNGVPTPYQSTFVVGLQLSDPRIYTAEPTEVTAVFPPSPGLSLPWPSLPITLISQEQEARIAVSNPGRAKARPVIRLAGPLVDPVLDDIERGVTLILDVTIPRDGWADVDFTGGTVTRDTGEDVGWAVRWPESTWWLTRNAHLPRGDSTLLLTATQATEPAGARLTFHPAQP